LVTITVEEGIVILAGNVPSPSHKYLIEATAWRLRGCRDVKNHLEVVPPRDEVAGELPEALRLILEKDRLVEADQIRISVQDKVIILEGFVVTEEEKEMAEADAWCLSAVEEVINKIEVKKTEV
jgi:osmotically-inducible protein OsmY